VEKKTFGTSRGRRDWNKVSEQKCLVRQKREAHRRKSSPREKKERLLLRSGGHSANRGDKRPPLKENVSEKGKKKREKDAKLPIM